MRSVAKIRQSKKLVWRACRVVLVSTILLIALLMLFEEKLIYFPVRYVEGSWVEPGPPVRDGAIIPRLEDCRIRTDDGVTLHGWYCTPVRRDGDSLNAVSADGVLLWFHGNAGNITHRYEMISQMITLPVDIMIVDYRGYGRSEGSASESGLYRDGRAAWRYLVEERGVAPERIVIFGKSLGGAVAIDVAASVTPAGLIVQSSFTSIADMARRILPVFPTFLLRTKMNSSAKIARIACPKLFIHGSSDEVVPFELGRRLYDAAPPPKQFYEVKRALHNDTYLAGGRAYFQTVKAFLDSCAPASPHRSQSRR